MNLSRVDGITGKRILITQKGHACIGEYGIIGEINKTSAGTIYRIVKLEKGGECSITNTDEFELVTNVPKKTDAVGVGMMELTKEQIIGMEPGWELDALIGEAFDVYAKSVFRVMNQDRSAFCMEFELREKREAEEWMKVHCSKGKRFEGYQLVKWKLWPGFSTDISAAWEVINKMMELKFRYVCRGNFMGDGLHHCAFDGQDWADANPIYQGSMCKTLPESICKAALIAIIDQ